MSIEIIQAKRESLIAQRDQQMQRFNMTIGAIAVCDELMKETLDDMERRKLAEAELQARSAFPPVPGYQPAVTEAPRKSAARAPAPHVMQPVSKFVPCDDCSTSSACEINDECRVPYATRTAPDGDAA